MPICFSEFEVGVSRASVLTIGSVFRLVYMVPLVYMGPLVVFSHQLKQVFRFSLGVYDPFGVYGPGGRAQKEGIHQSPSDTSVSTIRASAKPDLIP